MSKAQKKIVEDDDEFEDVEEGEEFDFEEEEEEEENTTIANPDVVQKYKFSAAFANKALATVLGMVAPGVAIVDLCKAGDQIILDEVAKVYNKGSGEDKIEKGIAFPTCISVNNVVCHFCPCEEEAKETAPLAAGDVVRVDLGCHIDGYCSVVADTVVVGASAASPATGKVADVIAATRAAMDVVTKALRPGTKAYEITELIAKVAEDYGVTPVEGVLSHNMRRYIIDGFNCIANRDLPDQKVRDIEIEDNQVWALNIVMSTGPGKLKQRENRVQVYKRALDGNYQLKLQASREVYNEINTKFQTFPFAVRHLDQKRGRIGITECLKHDVVIPYPVLYEKDGEHVAQAKSTVLVLATKIEPVTTSTSFEDDKVKSELVLKNEKALAWKARNLTLKKKNKGKKKASKAPAAAAPTA